MASPDKPEWKKYEEVAVYILDQIAGKLGLERVEGKQYVSGSRSTTEWEIDGKGVKVGGDGFIILECRRYTTSKQKQEQVAALAYRIIDTGADGAFLISPLGLQEGAERVASAEGIVPILMDQNSTRTDYMVKFLDRVFIGVTATMRWNVHADMTAVSADGTHESTPLSVLTA